MSRERRALTFFWLVVLLFTVGAFTADALLRREVCTSSMLVTQETTIVNPVECQ